MRFFWHDLFQMLRNFDAIGQLVCDSSLRIVDLNNGSESLFCRPDDEANLIIYNEMKGKFVVFERAALRADKGVVLKLPKGFAGDRVHGWMLFVGKDGMEVSTTVYLGELEV